jgi:WD40 repeat protein
LVYDAFISYSHAADGRLAPALQSGLQRLAKPWYRLRALRVFRDETGLSTNPHLWSSIVAALDMSEWFVLLASPESASSPWVEKEISHWLETKSANRILPVVTNGEWVWDRDAGVLAGDAVPRRLRDALVEEPRHLDLRWAAGETDLDLRNSGFRSAVADLAAPMHGVAKDELEGEDIRQHRRARRLARGGVALIASLLAVALAFGTYAMVQRGQAIDSRNRADTQARLATTQARLAQAQQLSAEAVATSDSDLARSLLLSVEGQRLFDNARTRGALLTVVQRAQQVRAILHGSFHGAALTPDSRELAVVDVEGVALIDIKTLHVRRLATPPLPDAHCAAISPDGHLLAIGGDKGVYLIDTRSGRRFGGPLAIPSINALSPSAEVRFSPDGSTLVEVARGGLGVVWSVPQFRKLGSFFGFALIVTAPQVDFSPDGRWFAATGVPGAIYDARTVQTRYTLPTLDSALGVAGSVSVAPSGLRLAMAGPRSINLLDVATGAQVAPIIPTGKSPASTVVYSRDGAILAGSRADGSIQLWDAHVGTSLGEPLIGATRTPLLLGFGEDSSHLVEVTPTEIVVFDLTQQFGSRFDLRPDSASAKSDGVNAVALSADGKLLVAAYESGAFDIWDAPTRSLRFGIPSASNAGSGATSAAFTDAHTVAIGDDDGTMSIWDARSGRRLRGPITLACTSIPLVSTTGCGVTSVAFDAPDRRLIALTGEGKIAFVDPSTGRVLRRTVVEPRLTFVAPLAIRSDGAQLALSNPTGIDLTDPDGRRQRRFALGFVFSLAYSPSGATLAVGLEDGRVVLIDSEHGAVIGPALVPNHGSIESLAFDAAGTSLAIGGQDGTVTLWDLRTRTVAGPPLATQTGGVFGLTFARDGHAILAGSADHTVIRYDIDPRDLVAHACATASRNLTRGEWQQYVGEAPYEKTCPQWSVGS